MQTFSISQLSRFSGIKQHTIRIWEQRYNALVPYRSEGNTRFYDDSQLRRLLNIVSLQNSNYKISELCALNDKSLFKLIEEKIFSQNTGAEKENYFIAQLIAAGISYREDRFDSLFKEALEIYGIKELYNKILYPLLFRLGLLWNCDNIIPPQEHFICNLLKQKLYSFIENLPIVKKENTDWVLLLPENEFHEIGLLMAYYILKEAKKKVVYLGANVPIKSFINSVKETGAANILIFAVHNGQEEIVNDYADLVFKGTKNIQFFLSCKKNEEADFKIKKGINFLHTPLDLEKVIK